jgi:hypothetical protein
VHSPSELDFDNLTLGEEAQNDSGPAPGSSSSPDAAAPAREDRDLVDALRAQLSDSNAALEKLKAIMQERLGHSMGLNDVQSESSVTASPKAPASASSGKGKASAEGETAAAPERDDDSHYFEVSRAALSRSSTALTVLAPQSYSYNGS